MSINVLFDKEAGHVAVKITHGPQPPKKPPKKPPEPPKEPPTPPTPPTKVP